MSGDYLDDLNKEQRRAVKYGDLDQGSFRSGPLLVIAGAGSGKTKTLAHRVAHLIVNGVDPHRILLLTFSRRAAIEMTRRVERITATVLGTAACDLPWSGTFHAIGARLLRECAGRIGLKPSFTILDRSDAADLMNLVRHDLKQSVKKSRFPKKDTCLAIYSFAVNSGKALEKVLAKQFPWCVEWEDDLRDLFAGSTEAKAKQNVVDYDDLLLYWAETMPNQSIHFGPQPFGISWNFQTSSIHRLRSLPLKKITGRLSRSLRPVTLLLALPRSGSQRTCFMTARRT